MDVLRGVNLGSWLLMEGYILGGRNISEHIFKKDFAKKYGRRQLALFEAKFRGTFIIEEDIKRIASWGANCIRVPFNYRLIEESPYKYSRRGISLLKGLVSWAKKHKISVILDLHAAAGAQNADWHSDSSGKALLWQKKAYQDRTFALWQYLASEFKDDNTVLGYDVLNEPVVAKPDLKLLKRFYKKLIAQIRKVDAGHRIFLEGNTWAQEIDFLEDLLEPGVSVSIHTYLPLDFTFNFKPGLRYPGVVGGVLWDKSTLKRTLKRYRDFSKANDVDIFVGEFGVNYRGGFFGELTWLKDTLDLFKEWDFHWTYWTYKCVARHAFPDGIIQYLDNSFWVRREGPVYGWENFLDSWKGQKGRIINSLKSKAFVENRDILDILKKYF
jgi:aryl-phospho-beta-D-glucosidase BglC (GH1 family)